MPDSEPKDIWDKFQIVSEFMTGILGSIVLVVISIVIGFSADKISRSLQTGELVDNLIEELTEAEGRLNEISPLLPAMSFLSDSPSR